MPRKKKPKTKKPKFKVIEEGDSYEVRKYIPQKRTITVYSKTYFLPFPYIVFGCHVHNGKGYLYCAFAKRDDKFVYWPAVPNVWDRLWVVCLGMNDGHYKRPETDLDSLITRFWQTGFRGGWNSCNEALATNYGTYHSWEGLSLEEAVAALESKKTKLEDFLKIVRATPQVNY